MVPINLIASIRTLRYSMIVKCQVWSINLKGIIEFYVGDEYVL